MKPLFPRPPKIKMDTVCVRLNQAKICNISSEVIKTGAYVIMNGEACIFTGSSGLLRFKLEDMKRLGQEFISIAEEWNNEWTNGGEH